MRPSASRGGGARSRARSSLLSSRAAKLLAKELHYFLVGETAFSPEGDRVAHRLACEPPLGLARRRRAIFSDEGAEALAAIDDVVALQLFISALHRDEAHLQLL